MKINLGRKKILPVLVRPEPPEIPQEIPKAIEEILAGRVDGTVGPLTQAAFQKYGSKALTEATLQLLISEYPKRNTEFYRMSMSEWLYINGVRVLHAAR